MSPPSFFFYQQIFVLPTIFGFHQVLAYILLEWISKYPLYSAIGRRKKLLLNYIQEIIFKFGFSFEGTISSGSTGHGIGVLVLD